ncbi:MAG: hypothetical protein WCC64_01515 [Aliidongia sp.]
MIDPTKPTLEEIEADLEISEAELAVGEVVSGAEIAAEVQAALARLAAKQRPPRHREAMRGL